MSHTVDGFLGLPVDMIDFHICRVLSISTGAGLLPSSIRWVLGIVCLVWHLSCGNAHNYC